MAQEDTPTTRDVKNTKRVIIVFLIQEIWKWASPFNIKFSLFFQQNPDFKCSKCVEISPEHFWIKRFKEKIVQRLKGLRIQTILKLLKKEIQSMPKIKRK